MSCPATRAALFACLLTSEFAGCSASGPWIEIDCPSGGVTTRVLRDTSAAYGVYASTYESSVRMTTRSVDVLLQRLPSETPLRPALLRFRRDVHRERFAIRSRLPLIVARLQSNPCGGTEQNELRILVKRIQFGAEELRKIAAACRDTSSDLESLIQDYRVDKD